MRAHHQTPGRSKYLHVSRYPAALPSIAWFIPNHWGTAAKFFVSSDGDIQSTPVAPILMSSQ
jgi:hypothetical protein